MQLQGTECLGVQHPAEYKVHIKNNITLILLTHPSVWIAYKKKRVVCVCRYAFKQLANVTQGYIHLYKKVTQRRSNVYSKWDLYVSLME